jgi:hypothetical protein
MRLVVIAEAPVHSGKSLWHRRGIGRFQETDVAMHLFSARYFERHD